MEFTVRWDFDVPYSERKRLQATAMRKPQTIVCYLAWCGAEVTYSFADAEEYQRVRAFLDKHSKAHASNEGLSSALSKEGVTDYYVIEKRDRTAFKLFMSDNR